MRLEKQKWTAAFARQGFFRFLKLSKPLARNDTYVAFFSPCLVLLAGDGQGLHSLKPNILA